MDWSEHLALTCSLAVSMSSGSTPSYWVAAFVVSDISEVGRLVKHGLRHNSLSRGTARSRETIEL
jgi:hypothetical protein